MADASLRSKLSHPTAAFVSMLVIAATVPGLAVAQGASVDAARGVLTFAPVLSQATSAVVNISVSATAQGQPNPLLEDPFFRRFFGGEQGADNPAPRRQIMAAGSGVIIDAGKGYVVTNNHVVERADKITVTTKDGVQIDGKLLGRDAETDIAVIQVPANALTALPVGDSDTLQVGDVVLAIGNPFGLGQTVISGIVSALGRSGLNAEHYENFIQTDASINPGNSGGALIDSKGRLVGINTAIIAPGGGNVGIGFAVPVSMVKAVVGQIERYGEVRRGRIGIAIQSVTPEIASAMGLGEARGVAVTTIERGSSAERAGLKTGDVIVELDGQPVRTAAQVRNGVGLKEAGSSVSLTILRDGRRETLSMAIERREQTTEQAAAIVEFAGATVTTEPG